MIVRAHVVLPVTGPPIANGALRISGGRILEVGRWREVSKRATGKVSDLGDVIVLPGLVNAHCHLDYTHMAGQFPPPKHFTDWLKLITSTKSGWDLADYTASWLAGAEMLLRTGTTTVADMEAVPQLLPGVWHSTPLRVFSFLELIGITARRPPAVVLDEALAKISELGRGRCRAALSPHAPYSTVPELLRRSARVARQRRWQLCTHVAESAVEYAMFTRGKGEMHEWLQRSGRDMSDCGLGSPVAHLERCGMLGKNLLVAHANYLHRTDAALLARRGVSVVHCPRSHAYFRHERFPLKHLLKAGVNVCLGTDSLASVYKRRNQTIGLNMFEEMRGLARNEPTLPARRIVEFATLNAARALGQTGRLGQLAAGATADLIALPFDGRPTEAYEAVLAAQGDVAATMIGGHWARPPYKPATHAETIAS